MTSVRKKFPLILLAIALVFTGGLALASAADSEMAIDSDSSSQNELRLERPEVGAENTAASNHVFQLAAIAGEKEKSGPTDQQKADWHESEREGPPPWAAARLKDIEGWFDSGREGPPPWAGSGSGDGLKSEWQEKDHEGPPPWSAVRKKDKANVWFDSDREGPPPWAGSRKEKSD